MDDLIDFGFGDNENKQLEIEGPEKLLAIKDDPSGKSKKKKRKEYKEEKKQVDNGEDLIDFNEPNMMDDLLNFGDNEDPIQLDHDSDDEE
jgi:hypothetical protein